MGRVASEDWRATSLQVGALVGIATGAVVYLLTGEVTPLLAVILPISAVMSLGLAFWIWKRRDEVWSTLWFLLGVSFVGTSAYSAAKWFVPGAVARVEAKEFPGFSADITGEQLDGHVDEYDGGWFRADDRVNAVTTTLLWASGTLAGDAGSPEHAAAWIAGFDYEEKVTVSPADRSFAHESAETASYKVFVGLDRHLATFVTCAERLVVVLTDGPPRPKTDKVHARTVSSIDCEK